MRPDRRYHGILYMLLAALGFSVMGGAAKLLKGSFNAGQLVFYRNLGSCHWHARRSVKSVIVGFALR